ncbi:MAG: sigma-70 family RNA polymerase sigma factor [Firmicutes bacterium]|nr:sigma-70 family RNA polymerase sigma factor [Bacillota bacterium]
MRTAKEKNLNYFYRLYCQNGKAALTALVCAGERLVRHYARLYNCENNEDILQTGRFGLIKAVKRFDPTKGSSFSTYASHYIRGEMRHYLRQEALYYRPGAPADLYYRLESYLEEILKVREEMPKPDELAQALQVNKTKVIQTLRAGLISLEDVDLSQLKANENLSLADKLALREAIHSLSELQQQVIYLLFFRDLTQTEAGKKLGIGQRQVSALLHKSLRELAKKLQF